MVAKAKSVDGEHSGGDVSEGNSGIRFNLGHRLPGSGAAIGQQTGTETIFKEDVRASVSAINGPATAFDPRARREDVSLGSASTARPPSLRSLSAGDDLKHHTALCFRTCLKNFALLRYGAPFKTKCREVMSGKMNVVLVENLLKQEVTCDY